MTLSNTNAGLHCRSDQSVYKHAISRSSQCSTTGVAMCYSVCRMMHIKEPLLLIGKVAPVAAAGFLSRYLSGRLPYV